MILLGFFAGVEVLLMRCNRKYSAVRPRNLADMFARIAMMLPARGPLYPISLGRPTVCSPNVRARKRRTSVGSFPSELECRHVTA